MRFDYFFEPISVDECAQLLDEYGPDAKLLAGGTDLVVKMRNRLLRPKVLVSLNQLPELARVYKYDDGIKIGAMARLMDLSKSPLLTGPWEVVKRGAGHVSSTQVRNIATIGGNTCNASPSADTIPGLMVLDAVATIRGPKGEREVPLEKFFKGPSQTALERGEFLLGCTIEKFPAGNGTAYKKYAIRGDTDIAIIGVATRLQVDAEGVVTDARFVVGAVAPVPLRIPDVEKLLIGHKLTDELAVSVGKAAADCIKPISDARATADYRKEMVRVWTKHVLKEAYGKAIQQ
ncbi:MAG: xanthine dehydrogenase family protein subunit M [Planctomycetaceae bacterium]|nr:xanthine dehydrogenase family protein subunit M [Planctomycetaceae bacterium]